MHAPQAETPERGRHVLLLYPTMPDGTYWGYDRALSLIGCKSHLPPLGLLTVASMLPASCEVRLVDMNATPLTDADLAWADVVFLSAMIVQKDSCQQVTARCQDHGVPVVAGGPYPSSAYNELANVDHFVIGEAEGVFQTFWADYAAGCAKRAYARVNHAKHAEQLQAHFGPDQLVIVSRDKPCMDEAPLPRFDLVAMEAYKSMAVQTSRGCPVGCEFCDIWRRFGRKARYKSTDRILDELDRLYELGWRRSVFVVDDNFIGNKQRAKEVLAAMATWQETHDRPFDFYTEATLTLADDSELLEGMRAAGFDMVFVGIETPAVESLKETRKHINTIGDMADRVRRIQSVGLQVTSGFIIGFDNDPDDIADRMIDCVQELGIPSAMVGLLLALPETDLYDRLTREGRIRTESTGNNTHAYDINFVTKRPAADILADYKRVLQALYPPALDSFFERCRILRDQWHPSSYPTRHVRWWDVRAFFNYLFTTLFHSYRWNALRFLATTAWHKPAFFPVAVSLGVQGHHFRTITRESFEVEQLTSFFSEQLTMFSRLVDGYRKLGTETLHEVIARLQRARDEILREAKRRFERLSRRARAAAREQYLRFRDEIQARYDHWIQLARERYGGSAPPHASRATRRAATES